MAHRHLQCKWALHESPVQSVPQPIAERQQCQKTWTLHNPDTTGMQMLPWIRKLRVSCPGFMFVSTATSSDMPLVRASSESPVALETLGVEFDSDGRLSIRARKSLFQHFLLIEIALPIQHALKKIKCHGSATVVIEDHVFVADQPDEKLGVKLTGSGSVFLTSQTEIHAKRFKAHVMGSGNVQITAPSMVLHEKLEACVVASGTLRFFVGNLHASKIETTMTGSGELQMAAFNYQGILNVEANMLGSGTLRFVGDALQATRFNVNSTGSGRMEFGAKDSLELETLKCQITGSGDIRFGCTQSMCTRQDLAIRGSGSIDTHDIIAIKAQVDILGSGNARLRAFEEVQAKRHGSGYAIVHGDAPQRISGPVQFAPAEPSHMQMVMSQQSHTLVAPTRTDAFVYCIQAGVFATMATSVFGVFRDIWKDLTKHEDKHPKQQPAMAKMAPADGATTCESGAVPMAVAMPMAMPPAAAASVDAVPAAAAAAQAMPNTTPPVATAVAAPYPGPYKQID